MSGVVLPAKGSRIRGTRIIGAGAFAGTHHYDGVVASVGGSGIGLKQSDGTTVFLALGEWDEGSRGHWVTTWELAR